MMLKNLESNAVHGSIYSRPQAYAMVFHRDFAAECDFLVWCSERHGGCKDRSFLDLGCGPAYHCHEMAQRGYRAVGLDLQNEMLALAREEAERQGLAIETLHADMTDFTLAKPVGLAACFIETISCLITDEQLVQHLRAVARNLLPGGVYVIETAHPRKVELPYEHNRRIARNGDREVEITWGLPDDPFDPKTRVFQCTRRAIVRERGEVVSHQEDRVLQRYFRAQDLQALIERSGCFAETHFYGRISLPALPLSDDPACEDMVVVMSKGRVEVDVRS